jgi:hypothetical protein
MAITDWSGGVLVPSAPLGGLAALGLGNAVFSGADNGIATVFQVPKTGNIRKIHWATANVTTGATVDVRLETVNTSDGFPSGTLVDTNTNASQVIANGDDSVFFTSTLTADAAVTAGEIIAFVVLNPTVSPGAMVLAGTAQGADGNFPYGLTKNTTWAKTAILLQFGVEYDDATLVPIPGIIPAATAVTNTNLSTSLTPDVAGWLFEAPVSMRVVGGWFYADRDGDVDLRLVSTAYNQGAGTGILAQSGTIDADMRRDAAGRITLAYFTSSYDVVAGTSYRLIVESTTTTTSVIYDWNATSLLALGGWPLGGCFTTAKDPTANGDWTNYNSGTFRRPLMGLVVSAVDSGVSSGGGGSRARVQRRM